MVFDVVKYLPTVLERKAFFRSINPHRNLPHSSAGTLSLSLAVEKKTFLKKNFYSA